jgi:hypothetical protein
VEITLVTLKKIIYEVYILFLILIILLKDLQNGLCICTLKYDKETLQSLRLAN